MKLYANHPIHYLNVKQLSPIITYYNMLNTQQFHNYSYIIQITDLKFLCIEKEEIYPVDKARSITCPMIWAYYYYGWMVHGGKPLWSLGFIILLQFSQAKPLGHTKSDIWSSQRHINGSMNTGICWVFEEMEQFSS